MNSFMNKIIINEKIKTPVLSNRGSPKTKVVPKKPKLVQNSRILERFKKTEVLVQKNSCFFGKKRKATQFNFFLFTDKFINLLMRDGKKVKASKLFFDMLIFLKKRIEKERDKKSSLVKHFVHDLSVLHFLSQAVENVTPSIEVRKVRVSGTTYLVPAILSKKRQQTTALRWIIESARKKQKNSNFTFSECLADEIFDASKKQGQARQKRDELHRLAEANRAYIRYRWW